MTSATAWPTIKQQATQMPAGWYDDPWYPDPVGSATWLRYWDGTDWTGQTALTVRDSAQDAAAAVHADAEDAAPVHEDAEDAAPVHEDAEDEAPVHEDAEDEAPAKPAAYDEISWSSLAGYREISWSSPAAVPALAVGSARAWLKALVACGLVALAVFAVSRSDHRGTTRAPGKASARLSQPAPARLSVRITSPAEGQTIHVRSVVLRGKVSRSHAHVTVNGAQAAVRGHRFTIRVPLQLGDNDFDVSAEMRGLAPGVTSVSVVRLRSAAERAELLARRVARRLAAQRRQERIAAEQSTPAAVRPAPSGTSGSTTTSTDDAVATDGDLEQLPPSSDAPPEPPASPPPAETAPPSPAADPEPSQPEAATP
jgi:uncharacterized Zn-binding protein involved in type VI secretion